MSAKLYTRRDILRDRARTVDDHTVEILAAEVHQFAHPLKTKEDLDPLMERIGDARYTDMAGAGMLNIGQVAREQRRDDGVVLVRFGSHHGSVIAGESWGAPMERMNVPEGRAGSWEDVLHQAGEDQLLIFDPEKLSDEFKQVRGQRAIGVVYHPEFERQGNYVPTVLPKRYDAFMYIDETRALHPLHIEPQATNPPDLYPWGV